jgi:hypothetical protein
MLRAMALNPLIFGSWLAKARPVKERPSYGPSLQLRGYMYTLVLRGIYGCNVSIKTEVLTIIWFLDLWSCEGQDFERNLKSVALGMLTEARPMPGLTWRIERHSVLLKQLPGGPVQRLKDPEAKFNRRIVAKGQSMPGDSFLK